MKDSKGFFEIFDGLMAIVLLFTIFLIFNFVLTVPDSSVSSISHEFKESQDVMEQLATKTNIDEDSFLDEITAILKEGKNSKRSVREVSALCKNKFKILGLDRNYYFTETSHLNGDEIISDGNIDSANNITPACRYCGDYCYVLYVW